MQGTREVRAALGRVPFPTLNRRPPGNHLVVYTDGSCLFPRVPQLRVASFASLVAGPDGSFEVLAQGLVPGGCHSAFRGEVMGLASAVHSVSSGVICCDCLSAVHIANDLLTQLRSRVTPELPLEHLDLWSWFLEGLAECELGSLHFRWVKGHTSWKKTHGLARLHAWYNHWADRAAAEAGKWVFELPAYHSLVRRYMARRRISRLVHDYQVQVAFTFAQKDKIEHPEPVPVTFRVGFGFPLSPYGACIEGAAFKHEGFARKLVRWLEGLYKVLLQYYSVLQSTTPVLLCTTKYYSSTTLYYKVLSTTPVLLCTTKYYSSTTLYYKVLLQYYSSTTLYYKVLLQYYKVLLQYYRHVLCKH